MKQGHLMINRLTCGKMLLGRRNMILAIRSGLSALLLLLVLYPTGNSEIITVPKTTEAVVGGSTYLMCSTNAKDKDIHWYHTEIGSTQGRNLVYGYGQFYTQYIGRFNMEKNNATGSYNLSISRVKVEDSGTYDCQDDAGSGAKASADLIVLEANPVCLSNMNLEEVIGPNNCGVEPSRLVLTCTGQYRGNEAPIMKWADKGNGNIFTKGVINTHNQTSFTYNLTIKGDALADGSSMVCSTSRSSVSPTGCDSGEIKITSKVVPACPSCAVPILCILLILFPIAIFISIFATRYRLTSRPAIMGKAIQRLTSLCRRSERKEKSTDEEAQQSDKLIGMTSGTEAPVQESAHVHPDPVDPQQQGGEFEDEKVEMKKSGDKNNAEKEKLIKEIKQLKANNASLKSLNERLQKRVEDLEHNIYHIDKEDATEPNLVSSIKTGFQTNDESQMKINGMTLLDHDLFVIHEKSPVVEVYDSTTFKADREFKVANVIDPIDLVSCKFNKCLYVFAQVNDMEGVVFKLDQTGKELIKWSIDDISCRLSTSYLGDVIVCLHNKQKVNEYKANGQVVRTVRLPTAQGLTNPWHALKVATHMYVVSHGDSKDKLHRICLVDDKENIQKEIRELHKLNRKTFEVPIYLAEDGERNILVADSDHNRIILLSSILEYKQKLISVVEKKKFPASEKTGVPVRMYLDGVSGRLFVAANEHNKKTSWKGNQILVYNVKDARKKI